MANIREYRDKNGKLRSFYIKVYRGRDVNGKQLKPYTATFKVKPEWTYKKAKKEVEKFSILFEEECRLGYHSINRETLGEYIDYVIELKKNSGNIKKRTAARWEYDSKRIKDKIGHIRLKDLRVSDLNSFYLSLDLSPKSINEIHRLISMVLSYAVKENKIVYNIASKAELPKIQKKEVNYFQKDDIIRILKAADNETLKHKVLIYLFVFTGARRGEIAGLRWKDVNFENKTLHIDNNVLYTPEYGTYEDKPKTKRSNRYIMLPESLISLLEELKKDSTSEYIIEGKNGKYIHPDSISTYLKRFSKKYDLPHINSHAFRHTMASMLYHEGVDAVSISARLGHSKVSTTSDIYSHTVNKYDENNVKILEELYIS